MVSVYDLMTVLEEMQYELKELPLAVLTEEGWYSIDHVGLFATELSEGTKFKIGIVLA